MTWPFSDGEAVAHPVVVAVAEGACRRFDVSVVSVDNFVASAVGAGHDGGDDLDRSASQGACQTREFWCCVGAFAPVDGGFESCLGLFRVADAEDALVCSFPI